MRKRTATSLCSTLAVLVCLGVTPASAQPVRAKKVAVDLVTAYQQCTAPNATHRPSLNSPACVPPALSTNLQGLHQVTFGAAGKMTVQLQTLKGDLRISVKGSDIIENGGASNTPMDGELVLRITDHGCGLGFTTPCTMTDQPFPFSVSCTFGRCTLKTSANAIIPNGVHAGDLSNTEILELTLRDADGDPAFRMGLLIP